MLKLIPKIVAYGIAISAILLFAIMLFGSPACASNCSQNSVCPTHGVSASFTGQTRMADRGCIYGKYSHGGCGHWALCYCPGE